MEPPTYVQNRRAAGPGIKLNREAQTGLFHRAFVSGLFTLTPVGLGIQVIARGLINYWYRAAFELYPTCDIDLSQED